MIDLAFIIGLFLFLVLAIDGKKPHPTKFCWRTLAGIGVGFCMLAMALGLVWNVVSFVFKVLG